MIYLFSMKATELRIGNIVYSGSLIHTVEPDDYMNWVVNGCWAEPIHLTEEWLDKFGFNQLLHSFAKDRFYITKWDKFDKWAVTHWGTNASIVNVKYVHQLQNLFHSLTGEELQLID